MGTEEIGVDKEKDYEMSIAEMSMSLPEIGGPGETPGQAQRIVMDKHREYLRNCRTYKFVYYATRLVAGLSAAILPFVVGSHAVAGTILSVAIIVSIVWDTVFDPKSKWKLYSRATDLLAVAELKANGQYDKWAQALDIIVATEQEAFANLKGLDEVLKAIQQGRPDSSGANPKT